MVAQAREEIPSTHTVKVLDLLTNRYHLGILRESSDAGLHVELPPTAHLHAGQRVRFIVAADHADRGIFSKNAMQRGFITQVSPRPSNRLDIRLSLIPETAVA